MPGETRSGHEPPAEESAANEHTMRSDRPERRPLRPGERALVKPDGERIMLQPGETVVLQPGERLDEVIQRPHEHPEYRTTFGPPTPEQKKWLAEAATVVRAATEIPEGSISVDQFVRTLQQRFGAQEQVFIRTGFADSRHSDMPRALADRLVGEWVTEFRAGLGRTMELSGSNVKKLEARIDAMVPPLRKDEDGFLAPDYYVARELARLAKQLLRENAATISPKEQPGGAEVISLAEVRKQAGRPPEGDDPGKPRAGRLLEFHRGKRQEKKPAQVEPPKVEPIVWTAEDEELIRSVRRAAGLADTVDEAETEPQPESA